MTTLCVGPGVCNQADRRRHRLAAAAADAAGRTEGAGATAQARLLRITLRCDAGRREFAERAEQLVRAHAPHARRDFSKSRRQANRAGPFIGAAIVAEPMKVSTRR